MLENEHVAFRIQYYCDCSPIDMIVVNNVMSTALGRKLVFGINAVT